MFRSQWVCRQCLSRTRVASSRTSQTTSTALRRIPRSGWTIQSRWQSTASIPAIDEDIFLSETLLKRARQLAAEHDALEKQLLDEFDTKVAARAGHLRPVSTALREYESAVENLNELRTLASDSSGGELASMAAEDIPPTLTTITTTASALTTSLIPRHPFASYPAILEIRPGTGGSEATIFTNDLYKMYTSFLSLQRWQSTLLSLQTHNEPGGEGVSEVILLVNHPESYNILRHEAGVHRVQRVPATEQKGRTHTSTATVMVLPSFGEADVAELDKGTDADPLAQIDMKEVKIDVLRASGAGGQHVNRTESAVRMTHIPTGLVVSMQDSRSQHKNRAAALMILKQKVAEKRRREKEEEALTLRRGVVKVGAGRSDKIRTYNYSQNRVTDHRAGISSHDLPGFMKGEGLMEMIEGVTEWDVKREVEVMLAVQEVEEEKKRKEAEGKA